MSEEKKAEMQRKNREQQSKSRSKWSPRRKKQEQAKNTITQRKLRIIEATSKVLKVNIHIVISDGDQIIGQGFEKKIQLGYIPELEHYVAIKPKQDEVDPNAPVDIAVEHYYAVDYVDRFYIGRVLSDEGNGFWKVKFLHQQSTDGVLHFLWPERDDVDKVHSSCIFWGPVFLEGCLDFTVQSIQDIEAVFRERQLKAKADLDKA